MGVAFNPQGGILVSASDDRTVKLWDAQSGKLIRTLEGHTELVTNVAFSSDGRLLASLKGDDKKSGCGDATLGNGRNYYEVN